METLKATPGTHDILPAQAALWDCLRQSIAEHMHLYAYGRIETPHFETAELFARSVGADSDIVEKEMYVFEDRGGRKLALRPEGTAGVVRAYIEAQLDKQRPSSKLWYWGPMFRAERPQKGRQRQFWQFGVEAVGVSSPQIDAEQIMLACRIISHLEIPEVTVRLNSIGDSECRPAYRDLLLQFLKSVDKDLCENCKRRMVTNPFRVLDCKERTCRVLTAEAPLMVDHLCAACEDHFAGVRGALDELKVTYQQDGRIVRGLDYYQRTAFEMESGKLGAQSSILGGGRYDGLIRSLGGADIPGVGWAAGVERFILAMVAPESPASSIGAFVVSFPETRDKALGVAERFRDRGVSTELDLLARSLKAQLREASRMNAKYAVLLGPDEWARGHVTIRNLEESSQEEVSLDDALSRLAACD